MNDPLADEATVTATAPAGGTATASSTPAQSTIKTVEYTTPSDMPEISWFWRRWYVFGVSAAAVGHIYWMSAYPSDTQNARQASLCDYALLTALVFFYIAGASAEGFVRLVGAIRTSRKETVTSTPNGTPE